ncbi:Rod cGMP-specific 3',5'-cyclic phosphodiesterase subunit beta [Plecturocebus cupreus]
MMDRNKAAELPKLQVGFIDFVCTFVYKVRGSRGASSLEQRCLGGFLPPSSGADGEGHRCPNADRRPHKLGALSQPRMSSAYLQAHPRSPSSVSPIGASTPCSGVPDCNPVDSFVPPPEPPGGPGSPPPPPLPSACEPSRRAGSACLRVCPPTNKVSVNP